MNIYKLLRKYESDLKTFIENLIPDLLGFEYSKSAYTYHISFEENEYIVYINIINQGDDFVISSSDGNNYYNTIISNYIEVLKRRYNIENILL